MKAFSKISNLPAWVWINALLVTISISVYVLMASKTQSIGFPLDDAWIHQTYARNLAEYGEWSFIPGTPTAGSTSPLWTLLLSFFYRISDQTPYFLTYLLGAVCLWALACVGELIFRRAFQMKRTLPLAGMFLALEWHLVWAGASGMETILMALLILVVFYFLQKGTSVGFVTAGLLTGVGVWIRPDALTLIGPLIFCIVTGIPQWKERVKISLWSLGAGLIPVSGYLLFNLVLSGQVWPNTFYAKQAEYSILQETSIFARYTQLIILPFVGAGVLLLPGFIVKLIRSVRQRDWYWISLILWWLGYTLIYAMRLPVTYQHGRYLMPAMPVFFLIGLVGSAEWVKRTDVKSGMLWVLQKGWLVSLAAVLVVFTGLGATSYARDVAIINTEMVETAKWLNMNTEENDLIAVHDIGAVGYFSQRDIIDLAGLVSPEVIPIIRDETELARLLDARGADYLMTFPGWYLYLTDDKEVVFQTDAVYSIDSGGENMTVYRWEEK